MYYKSVFKYLNKITAGILSVLCVFSVALSVGAVSDNQLSSIGDNSTISTVSAEADTYYDYYNKFSDQAVADSTVTIGCDSLIDSENKKNNIETFDNVSGIIISDDNSWSTWEFDIAEAGIYSIKLNYYPIKSSGLDIEMGIMIDDNYAFSDISDITLPRTWTDENKIARDVTGNDIRPTQIEKECWKEKWIENTEGMYEEPYRLYIEAGHHTVKLLIKREAAAISEIVFGNKMQSKSYAEYIKNYTDQEVSGDTYVLQAEEAYEKSNSMLYPIYDRGNVATYPSDPVYTRYNTIGGDNWSSYGDSISWVAEVPEDGLYQIQFRVRQNFNPGLNSYRNFYINGELPFDEAKNIAFEYQTSWYIKTLGDDKPLMVYLKKGDIITLEATSGELAGALRGINHAVLDLNNLYRQIIVITGSEPDTNRDYGLEGSMPDLIDDLKNVKSQLENVYSTITTVTKKKDSQASSIVQLCSMIDDFIDDSELVPKRLSKFKSNIETISSLILSLNNQPLELDCIGFITEGGKSLVKAASFGETFIFEMKKFTSSFISDYNSISESDENSSLTVWVGTGRDQAQVIDNLIKDTFTPVYGTTIKLSMVETKEVLLQATLAGKGPDIALMVEQSEPVNLAMRGALIDLTQYVDHSKLSEYFNESALKPFYYQNGLYGLPETESFNLIFYRTDILKELNLEVPSTWDEFYHAMEVIQKVNLQVGINEVNSTNAGVSASIPIFDAFLFQRGGTYYNENLSASMFDTTEAYDAFDEWVTLYRDYKLAKSVEFYNRLRSGEMPLGITSITIYNQLMAAAPEIRGLWSMAPIPGIKQADGTVNRSESSVVSGCMAMTSAEKKGLGKEAAEFLLWWISTDTQYQYGMDLEATMGIGARYYPANMQAFKQLGWSKSESSIIQEQWKYVINVNQIPGNYIITRNLTNALRSTFDVDKGGYQTRRQLTLYNNIINDEITRKRKEFNLDK